MKSTVNLYGRRMQCQDNNIKQRISYLGRNMHDLYMHNAVCIQKTDVMYIFQLYASKHKSVLT